MKLYCKLKESINNNHDMHPVDYCFPSFSVDVKAEPEKIEEGFIEIKDNLSIDNFWDQIENLTYDEVTSAVWYFEPMYFSNHLVPLEYLPQHIIIESLKFRINIRKHFIIKTQRATINDLKKDYLGNETVDYLEQLPESMRNRIVGN